MGGRLSIVISSVKFIRAAISLLGYRDVSKKTTSSNDWILPPNNDFNFLTMGRYVG